MIWRGIPLAMAALGLMGCGSASTDGRAGQGGAAEASVTMEPRLATTRPYVGKPRPPIRVTLSGQPVLEAGVPGTLRLGVRAAVMVSGLSLVVEGDDGLTVTGIENLTPGTGLLAGESASLEPGLAAEYQVHTLPSSGGLRSLSGQLRFIVGGVEQAVPFRLAVGVDGPTTIPGSFEEPRTAAVIQNAGQPIVSMKAETRVR